MAAHDTRANVAGRGTASGALALSTRLRARRDLATYYEISHGTVLRAMEVLRERGLIETVHGRGTFVHKDRG